MAANGRWLWIVFLTAASTLFSFALACVTPFAALAALAALSLPRRDMLALIGIAWLANQIVGYLWLGYPLTFDSVAWGVMLGVAALLAALAADLTVRRLAERSLIVTVAAAFLAAAAANQAALLAATLVLPASDEAFSLLVVLEVAWTNALALAGLLALHQVASAIGITARSPSRTQPLRAN